jgi:hypothetical protein
MMPSSNDLMLPILRYSESDIDTLELEKRLAEEFNLSENERNMIKNSGNERLFLNKIRWAKTHLHYAGLIEFTKKNWFKITQRGMEFIRTFNGKITESVLYRFKEYVEKRLKIVFEYAYCMPNKWTFQMKPVRELLEVESKGRIIDGSCGQSDFADIRNDLNADTKAHCHLDITEFFKRIRNEYADTVLLDLPYSSTQISVSYKNMSKPKEHSTGLKESDDTKRITMLDTSSHFYSKVKDEIKRVVKKGGKVISFGWNSVGMGKERGFRGFKKTKIMLVCHGGNHHDTIVTVEEKL